MGQTARISERGGVGDARTRSPMRTSPTDTRTNVSLSADFTVCLHVSNHSLFTEELTAKTLHGCHTGIPKPPQ
jgi:hypothetical protein